MPKMNGGQSLMGSMGLGKGVETQQQMQMLQHLLGGANAAAQQSQSPLLAGLTPILGAAIGSGAQTDLDTAQQKRDREAMEKIMRVRGMLPQAAPGAAPTPSLTPIPSPGMVQAQPSPNAAAVSQPDWVARLLQLMG